MSGWADRVGEVLRRVLNSLLYDSKDYISERIAQGRVRYNMQAEQELIRYIEPLMNILKSRPELVQVMRDIILDVNHPHHQVLAELWMTLIGYGFGTALGAALEPVFYTLTQQMNQLFPVKPIDISAAAQIGHRFPELDNVMYDDAYVQGYSKGRYELYKQLYYATLSVNDLLYLRNKGAISDDDFRRWLRRAGFTEVDMITIEKLQSIAIPVMETLELLNRGKISEETAREQLKRHGYNDEQLNALLELRYYLPSVSDVIRFAVREAYTPEAVERFQLDAEAPKLFFEEAKKRGLTEEQAKYYWRAHWELPSVTQAFEMYHRGVIDDKDLDLLLKTHDIMPYFRDKLKAIAYEPFTRVDIRRMFELGVMSYKEMVKAYQDLGYSPENAEKLARFTTLEVLENQRVMIQDEVVLRYRNRLITRDEAKGLLKESGMTDETAENLLTLEDFKVENKRIENATKHIRNLYINNYINRNRAREFLGRLGLHSAAIEEMLTDWDFDKAMKVELPTRADLLRWLRKGIIPQGEFRNYMRALGYDDKVIDYYILDAGLTVEPYLGEEKAEIPVYTE